MIISLNRDFEIFFRINFIQFQLITTQMKVDRSQLLFEIT